MAHTCGEWDMPAPHPRRSLSTAAQPALLRILSSREYADGMSTPLAPPAFWILTALASRRRHGYEILQAVAAASDGRVALKVPTLYATLERLETDGSIRTDGEEIVNGRARRYFVITEQGTERLSEEIDTMERAARAARTQLTARGPALTFTAAVRA